MDGSLLSEPAAGKKSRGQLQTAHDVGFARCQRFRGDAMQGSKVRVDLRSRRVDVLISDEEIERRRRNLKPQEIRNDSPWQEIYRKHVGQLAAGACLDFAVGYRDIRKVVPRHSH